MNERERYLLACIGEECGEIQQVVGKMLKFGVYSTHEKIDNIENRRLLYKEVTDLIAVYDMYCEEVYNLSEVTNSDTSLKNQE